MSRVRIGTCSGPAEAALLRSVFEAHDIHVVIGGEQHASMMGGLGGSFISLDIWVAEHDAEDAAALLHDIRQGASASDEDTEVGALDDDAAPEHADSGDRDGTDGSSTIDLRIAQRRSTGIVLLLAVCVTFGTGHMYARKWLRALVLAGIEVFGLVQLADGHRALGLVCFGGAVLADAVGATIVVRTRPALPKARIVER